MTTAAGVTSLVPEVAASPPSAARTDSVRPQGGSQAAAEPMLRLVIEEDQESGAYVYKTLDSRTGEVILQLPREEVLKALRSGEYNSGDVFQIKA